jgi:hypothetical protein
MLSVSEAQHSFFGDLSLECWASVRHESAPLLAAERAAGKARPSAFRTKPWA